MRTVDDPLDPPVFGRDCSGSKQRTQDVSFLGRRRPARGKGRRSLTILEQVEPGFQGIARTDGLVASSSEEEDGTLDLLKDVV